jgi:hypothetical protein
MQVGWIDLKKRTQNSSLLYLLSEISGISRAENLTKPVPKHKMKDKIIFHISFSMATLVAHLNKALRYLPPAKYIPAKKTRCAIIIKRGPPMIINKGSCQ